MAKATPKAASLAAELGVSLEQIEGSGKGGRILVGDVQRAAKSAAVGPLRAAGARVLRVFGLKRERALIEVPTEAIGELLAQASDEDSVVTAVERDLEQIARLDPELSGTAEAAVAIELARQLDDPFNSAHSKSLCARALIEALEDLRERAPDAPEADSLDELAARRATRLARAAGT